MVILLSNNIGAMTMRHVHGSGSWTGKNDGAAWMLTSHGSLDTVGDKGPSVGVSSTSCSSAA